MSKICGRCGVSKDKTQFAMRSFGVVGSYCRKCVTDYCRVWRRNNPDKFKEQSARRNRKIKHDVISKLGGICSCCGESRPQFMQIDHINNDGAKHRRSLGGSGLRGVGSASYQYRIYKEVLSGKTDGLQLLCANCNWGKARNSGVCPHAEERIAEAVLAS